MAESEASYGTSAGRASRVYRTLGRTAHVDETLFGGRNHSAASAKYSGKEVAIVGKDTVQVRNKHRSQSLGVPTKSDAVVISASALNRLRDNAMQLTKEQEVEMKKRAEEVYAERMKRSKERKENMMRMEEERKKRLLMKEESQEGKASRNSVLERAKQMLDEDMDDVKQMNQMMLYSKIVTVRDAQLHEKRHILSEKEKEERELDNMMEIERLRVLKSYEEREKQRLDDQRKGADVIIDQIKDRQATRMRQEEARDQERLFILKQLEDLQQEELEQQQQKKLNADRLMKAVNDANTAAMSIKETRKHAEKLEDQKIFQYQAEKLARERELEEEKHRLAAEKELETAKLRARQEKAQDKAAEMDALRAKRAMEAAERRAREKEKTEKQRQEAINAELNQSRKQQQAEKECRLGEQAKFERDEFERIIEVQMQQEDAERARQEDERELRKSHAAELRAQIAARKEKTLQERHDFLDEGNAIRASIAQERSKLEKIKGRKIGELQKAGVPEKYQAELARKQISF